MGAEIATSVPSRCSLPEERSSITHKFTVGDFEGYIVVGLYPDGMPGEIFIKTGKEGSTLKGMLNAFAISVSIGLQHGIPLSRFVKNFKYMRFEPEGTIGQDASSIVDYIFRWLEDKFTPESRKSGNGNGHPVMST